MVSTRLSALTAAALLAVGLSACDGSTAPVTTPPPSIDIAGPSDGGGGSDGGDGSDDGDGTAPVAAEIPAPDPADFPGIDEETPQGAEQAFRYYWAVLVWAHQVGETEQLEALSDERCELCKTYVEDVKGLAENERLWVGAMSTDVALSHVSDSEAVLEEGYDLAVTYEFLLSEHTVVDPQSEERVKEAATTYRTTGGLNWSDGGWRVSGLAIMPLSEDES